ncbi:MAG: type II/IV secretion system ATPase subunit [Desulfurococcaceae archaeon]
MSEIKVRLTLLRKPPSITCDEKYNVGKDYEVCISGDKYYVYDIVSEDPNIGATISNIELLLSRMLSEEKVTPDEMLSSIEERYRHIVQRHYYGYGLLDPLFIDDNIMDMHIVLGTPIQVLHRKYGPLTTNIQLNQQEMIELSMRLSSIAGKIISEATPIASFIEPRYESRVTIVHFSDITLRKGMTIDIRKQPSNPWTILKLIEMNTATPEEAAFLWLAIKYKVPIMIVGELMSGKTTFANAVLNLIPPNSRIMTIEDTPELKIHTPFWTRTTIRYSKYNPVHIFDLIKIALRLTVDYIVVGEVRGEEAREWAQAILLGHGGLTTFHAESPEAALIRLTNPPIRVNPEALKLLSIFVKMIPIRTYITRKLVRRSEIYVQEDGRLVKVFSYDPASDAIVLSVDDPLAFDFIKRIALVHGVSEEDLRREYKAMVYVIRSLLEELKSAGRSVEEVDYRELPNLLYTKLGEALNRETT